MAIKDWRKDGKNDWFHKIKNIHIEINNIPVKYSALKNAGYKYNINIVKNGIFEVQQAFKTKSQALKYARNYMKKH